MGKSWIPRATRQVLAAAALAWHAQAVPPSVAVQAPVYGDSGTEIRWTASSPELRHTLESRTDLGDAPWEAVPGVPWPSPATRVLDGRPDSASRFYRIVAEPGPVDRGRLLEWTRTATLNRSEIQFLFDLGGFPALAQWDVHVYRVLYETVDAQRLRTRASGAVAVPVNHPGPLPLVSYQHGTVLLRDDVPSRANLEGLLGVAFATDGYAAVLPDYLGLGDSPGVHPYHHADSAASAVIDLLRAARALASAEGIPFGPRLFLTGYSQGGHATLAALREIEAHHAAEFPVTACAAGGGAYDLSGVTRLDFLSGRPRPNPFNLVYLLTGLRDVYGFPDDLAAPYATLLPPLLDGTHEIAEVNAVMPRNPLEILRPEAREALASDPDHPFRAALRRNDLLDWAPRAPLRLYHCAADRDVPQANATAARDAFAARGVTVTVLDPEPSADHQDCALPTLLDIKAWFDTLRH
ncbi:MAG: hypothetical protein J0L84_09655 [Verrucomicrobia bacterium]|nr:hypothetical protein [Verrucomicrobiota bacterium]